MDEREYGGRERCAKCSGSGWLAIEDDDGRSHAARRCRCNPGEMPRAWHGGTYGTSSYADEPGTPAWENRQREKDQL